MCYLTLGLITDYAAGVSLTGRRKGPGTAGGLGAGVSARFGCWAGVFVAWLRVARPVNCS